MTLQVGGDKDQLEPVPANMNIPLETAGQQTGQSEAIGSVWQAAVALVTTDYLKTRFMLDGRVN